MTKDSEGTAAVGQKTGERKMAMAVVAVSMIAVLMAGAALAATFAKPSAAPPTGRTISITVTIGEGFIVTGYNNTCQCAVEIDSPEADTEKVVGEYVRWEPSAFLINVGDTVKLTVENHRKGDHGFAIMADAGSFSGTTSVNVQGRTNSGNPAGGAATIEFTALKAGTYTFICPVVFDDAKHWCHPDHESLTGTVMVV
ncbi:MAG TPA: hypothetical protein VI893_05205 [Thermoplasmata archaeon]|nr:hypothetical protein [Thermoplasmata archaeon]